MPKLICLLIACLWTAPALPADVQAPADKTTVAPAPDGGLDSRQMEKDLQHLPWQQFRSIIESVPKMKADVEAYGQFGWSYVQANYTTYGWKKNIDRLDDAQKKQLSELIQAIKGAR